MSDTFQICSTSESLRVFSDHEQEFSLVTHPFEFQREHWFVEQNGKRIARIAAATSLADPKRGYIGFFQNFLNGPQRAPLSQKLLRTAEDWLRQQGVTEVFGPVNYSTWFPYRFQTKVERLGTASDQQFDWEPAFDPASWMDWIQSGYTTAETYHSKAHSKIDAALKPSEASYLKHLQNGFNTRPMKFDQQPEIELNAIEKINQGSFSDQFLVEPIEASAYQTLYATPLLKKISEFSFFILDPNRKEIGYSFSFIDQGYLVWKTMAILREFQGKGLATLVIHHSLKLAQKYGVNQMVAALMRSGASSEVLLNKISTPLWNHEYVLLKKML